jgi:hypothetical protein
MRVVRRMDKLTNLQAGALGLALVGVFLGASYLCKRFPVSGLAARLFRRVRRPSETIQGYEHPELVEVVFQKALAYAPQGEWPEMVGVTSVLDFGGGCGVHHKLARLQSPDIKWAVVETPAMVARAAELATDRLRFFDSIREAAAWLGSIEVIHSSGALQYTPEPEQTLRELCGLNAKKMLWLRMALSTDTLEREMQSSNLGDNGPGRLAGLKEKTVLYARTKLPEKVFLDAHKGYALTARGPDSTRCRLRVKSCPDGSEVQRPLWPRNRTQLGRYGMSVSCQERTWAPSPPQGRYTRNAVTMPCGWLSDCGGEAMSCLIARAGTQQQARTGRTLTARHRVVISDTARTAA